MDLGVGTSLEVDSDHHDEDHPLGSGRKRKLQPEELFVSEPNHKFRGQRTNSGRGFPAADHLVPEENPENVDEAETDPEPYEAPEQIEASPSKDKINLPRVPDNLMALDPEGHLEKPPEVLVPRFEPPSSSSGMEGIALEGSLYSLNSRVAKNNDDTGEDLLPENDDDDKYMEDEWPDDEVAEFTLSCGDAGSITMGLSSEMWSSKQDAVPPAMKPTIDKEFERYFSVFMP